MDVARGLTGVLRAAAGALSAASVPYCLVGGLAVSMLSRPRATEDVDLIVAVDQADLPGLEIILRQAFEVIQVSPLRHFPKVTLLRILVEAEDFPGRVAILDLLLADRDEYRQAVAGAVTIVLDGTPVAVARAEHLIAVKRLAGRPVDLLDIQELQEALDGP